MPTQTPRQPKHITPERIRTGIIVSVVISVVAILVVVYILLKRRQNARVKVGTINGRNGSTVKDEGRNGGRDVNGDLEVGIVKEVAPVYMRDLREGERRVG
jgi:hypothetical protein